jgi:two-component system chemotaxis response regulator CheY
MLRTLIVEDEFTSRKFLNAVLAKLGPCDIAWNGKEAVEGFAAAMKRGTPYDLVCLDIIMPVMDGHAVLGAIREMERAAGLDRLHRVKVIMTTGFLDQVGIAGALPAECDAYLLKPIETAALMTKLSQLGLLG